MPQRISQFFPHWLQDEFKPGLLLPSISSGVITGIIGVIDAIAMGSLVFAGALAPYISRGIGIALFASAMLMVIMALTSKVPAVIGITQDTSTVILAITAAGLVGTLSGMPLKDQLATILVTIAIAALLTGVFFILLGTFKLGVLVRYIPYPVVGGFLAGTGWLLVQGAFPVMTDFSLKSTNIPALLQPGQVILWVPGIMVAMILFFGIRHIHHALTMPGILIGAIVAFYLAFLMTGTSIESATRQGFLLGQSSVNAAWHPLFPSDLMTVHWKAILGQGSNIAILLILSLFGLLLNASALELVIHQDIDLNRELRAVGIANILSGLGGGMVGYHALSLSTLSYRMGARGRLPGLIAAAICLLMLFAGNILLAFLPRPILGGLLVFIGLDFLIEWLVVGWKKLSHTDYGVVVLILVVIAATNFLIGVAVGLIVTIILFVWNYSRIDVVHHALSGAEMHSNVERCTYHRQALEELGRGIYILELQGFIFFGTGITILERIRTRIVDPQPAKVRYIILDFRRVSGLDSSAWLSLNKAFQLAASQGIILLLTHIPERLVHQLGLEELSVKDNKVRVFPDLDRGLEWCEEQLLEINQITGLHTPVALVAQLADSGFEKNNTIRLRKFLERIVFRQGETLIHQGDEADTIYFIELGSVSVFLETEGGERVRLQTYGLGTAVGEMDLYQGVKCTATVIADSPVTTYKLTRAALSEMKAKEPELAVAFHEFIAHLLSERLAATTHTLKAIIR